MHLNFAKQELLGMDILKQMHDRGHVLQGMKACAAERWGQDSIEKLRVAIQDLGSDEPRIWEGVMSGPL